MRQRCALIVDSSVCVQSVTLANVVGVFVQQREMDCYFYDDTESELLFYSIRLGSESYFPVMISERHSGQLDEWLVLNHCVPCQPRRPAHDKENGIRAYLVETCRMESVLARLAGLLRQATIHSADHAVNESIQLFQIQVRG